MECAQPAAFRRDRKGPLSLSLETKMALFYRVFQFIPMEKSSIDFFFLLLKLSLDPNKCRDGGNIDLIIKIKKHFLIELFC